ncbi:MAG: TRAP transporter small permease [Pseudomonadota bacterium]
MTDTLPTRDAIGSQADAGRASPNAPAPAGLRHALDAIDALGWIGGWVAALSLMTLALLILGEVCVRLLSRYVSALPPGIPSAWEISSFLMGTAFMCGAAVTLRAGGHIRVSVLTSTVPASVLRVLEIVVSFVGLALTAFLAYSMVMFALSSFMRGQTSISSDIPLWFPKAVLAVGAIILALQMLARLVHALLGLPLEDPRMRPKAPGA